MAGQDALYAVAQAVLASTVTALDTYGKGAPALQYVAPGQPAYDCEQLTVHYQSLAEAPTRGAAGQLGTMRRSPLGLILHQPLLAVTVLRECVVPEEPGDAAEQLDALAQTTMDDGWMLWRWYHSRHRDGSLFSQCSEVQFLPGVPVVPGGGIYGWVFGFAVTLPAPDPMAA